MVITPAMKKILIIIYFLLLSSISYGQYVIRTDNAMRINMKSKEFQEHRIATNFYLYQNVIFIRTADLKAKLTYFKTSEYIDLEKNTCYKFFCKDIENVACEVIYIRRTVGDYVIFIIGDIKIVYRVAEIVDIGNDQTNVR